MGGEGRRGLEQLGGHASVLGTLAGEEEDGGALLGDEPAGGAHSVLTGGKRRQGAEHLLALFPDHGGTPLEGRAAGQQGVGDVG